MQQLQSALSGLQNTTTGPGTESRQAIASGAFKAAREKPRLMKALSAVTSAQAKNGALI